MTQLEDAELAVALGAWAVGLNFFPASPRCCSIETAQQIAAALRRRVHLCGVFVNASLDEVASTAEAIGLTMVQLHGDEGPAFCGEVARRTGAKVIRAVQISTPGEVRDLERFHVDYHLVDARSTRPGEGALRGGTGETFDWSLLRVRRSRLPLIVSGGLHPGNVGAAIAATHPFAVDTASGTDARPGHKDPELMRAFFEAVARTAEVAATHDTDDATVVPALADEPLGDDAPVGHPPAGDPHSHEPLAHR